MNIKEFNEGPASSDIIFCIIDNTHTYTSDWNKELIKNISDFCLQNITIQGYTVLQGIDEDSLLKAASTRNCKYAVVLTTGTEFITRYVFFDLLNELLQKETFFLLGHVLDRKDCYYELHQQCYVINLEVYKSLGMPRIGNQEFFSPHIQTCPKRSIDTYHDNHTPKWVEQGTDTMQYQHKAHGWNILSIAFSQNLPVKIFNDAFRESKKHYYPENEHSFVDQINYAYSRLNFCSSLAVYPINSEKMKFDVSGPLRQLIVPASGLGWIEHLANIGYSDKTVVKFFDYSPPTLEYLKAVIDWNGENYPKFFREFMDSKYGYLQNNNSIIYCGPQDIESEWAEFSSQFNWKELWADIKSKVTFEFYLINLLDSTDDLNWIENLEGTSLINISNIFNYIGTATFYSIKQRLHAETTLLTKLKDKIPEMYVQVSRFASDGFVKRDSGIVQIKNISAISITDFNVPTWHQTDWTI